MAGKKLVFDPTEEPETGYNKWVQEYLRLKDAGPGPGGSVEEEDLARSHIKYFEDKLKKEKEAARGPRYKPYQPPKKKKPWPGWSEKIEELAEGK